MKKLRKISKKYYVRQSLCCWLMFYMLFCFSIPAQVAMAAPQGGVFQGGDTGTIVDGVIDSTVLVNQMESVIHWDGLNTSGGESLTFTQLEGLSNAAVLNRVVGEGATVATQFDGALNGANMRIFMINPAGIVFGSGSSVNVSQLVASSLNITDDDFRNGAPYTFTGGAEAGDVVHGAVDTITADTLIALIGKNVVNSGTLNAEGGYVVMAAGDTVTISEVGSAVGVVVTMPDADISDYTVKHNGGTINAQHVILAAGDIWSSALIDADGAGTASVKMTAEGDIRIDGDIYADATAGSDAVATIDITAGDAVYTTDYDDIEASAAGNGVDNATAAITIKAGRYIEIEGSDVIAEAYDGVTNTATVELTTTTGDIDVIYDSDEAEVEAWASGGTTNIAKVTIDAGEDVLIGSEDDEANDDEYVDIWADATGDGATLNQADISITAGGDVTISCDEYEGLDDDMEIHAEAQYGLTNLATVTIDAEGDVEILSDDDDEGDGELEIHAYAHGGKSQAVLNEAKVDIDASNITLETEEDYAEELEIYAKAWDGTTNTATIDIDAASADSESGNIDIWSDEANIEIYAYAYNNGEYADGATNTSAITMNASGYIDIYADGDDVYVYSKAYNSTANTASLTLDAGGDIDLETADDYIELYAYAYNDDEGPKAITNNATITLNAGDDIDIYVEDDFEIYAEAYNGTTNTASVTMNAGDDIDIEADDDDIEIYAQAYNGTTNTASIGIDAGGYVDIEADGDDIEIYAQAWDGTTNTASIDIDAGDDIDIYADSYDYVYIEAQAWDGISNTATVDVDAGGYVDVEADGEEASAAIEAIASNDDESNIANVTINAGESVSVSAYDGGNAEIFAEASYGVDNTAGVKITTEDGGVAVYSENAHAEISAIAEYADNSNTATVDIDVVGGDVEVIDIGGDNFTRTAEIYAEAYDAGNGNTADVQITATATTSEYEEEGEVYVEVKGGNVEVIAENGGNAQIYAGAKYGIDNTSTVGVCANGHVIVATGIDEIGGGEAKIKAEAEAAYVARPSIPEVTKAALVEVEPQEPTSATARTVVVSHNGSVVVGGVSGGKASIEAKAYSSNVNIADVGVAAGADLAPADVPEDLTELEVGNLDDLYDTLSGGHVIVYSDGQGGDWYKYSTASSEGPGRRSGRRSQAFILAKAQEGDENTADVVVCAPGVVAVINDGERLNPPSARIRSISGDEEDGELNTASTQVYASDVYVSQGARIAAVADGDNKFVGGDSEWFLGDLMPEWEEGFGDGATLLIDTYENRQDCPECDEEETLLAPVAPLYQIETVPRIEGCPQLVQAAATELGITAETIQVGIGNALALNPGIQACQACSSLMNAAAILRDEDGSRMAAMVQMFNALAPADAPFTAEMGTSIAMAFEGAAEGSQYASVIEYVDAFVQYATALETGLGSPAGDSVAFVLEKYGSDVLDSDNGNIAAFVAARLEAIR